MKQFLIKLVKKFWMAFVFLGLLENSAYSYEIPIRGVVEGFYGTPWTQKERLDLINFAPRFHLNAYIYAPKDDPYHRELWREPYPEFEEKNIAKLIKAAKENNVRFIFAISPGLDIEFYGEKGKFDRESMQTKLENMYNLGVRDFAIFFDDIENKNAEGQAEFLNYVTKNFVKTHVDVSPLITVPTEYFTEDMEKKGQITPYTKTFSETLDKDILVLYTGRGVVKESISDIEYRAANRLYGRDLGIWWNYPVDDYMESKLALGPIENLPIETKIPAIFYNPMKYAEMSKIALGTGGLYAKFPSKYDPDKAIKEVIKFKYKDIAKDMMLVAAHSTHLENDWAKVGREDGIKFNEKTANLFDKLIREEDADIEFKEIEKELAALKKSTDKLLEKMPRKDLREFKPQLDELNRLVEVSKNAVTLLKSHKADRLDEEMLETLKDGYDETIVNQEKVKIADGSLVKFIKDTLDLIEKSSARESL